MKFALIDDLTNPELSLAFDLKERGRLALVGPDARKLMHNLCSNEVNNRAVGDGFEAFLLNAKGSIVDLVTSYIQADRIALDVEPGRLSAVWKQFDRYIIREQVKLTDYSESLAHWHVRGQQVPTLFKQALGNQVPDQPYQSRSINIGGHEVEIRSHQRSHLPGYDLLFPAESGTAVMQEINTLLESNLKIGPNDWLTAFRIALGWPIVGKEIGELNLAQEMVRDKSAISFTKGCYIGQETVARLDAMGHVNKTLAGLLLDLPADQPIPSNAELEQLLPTGSKITLDGKDLGLLGSVAYLPTIKQYVALAILRVFGNQPGTVVSINTPAKVITATVTALPISA